MTRSSDQKEFRTGYNSRVERLIALGRAVVGFERVWPALWPASAVVAVFIALAEFGALDPLPWPVHALALSGAITATGLLLYLGFRSVSLPTWEDGARRVEIDSGLKHRPISAAADLLLAGAGDSWAEELWRAHLRHHLSFAAPLRLSRPKSLLDRRDPRALRFVVLLVLGAALVFSGRESFTRLANAFSSEGSGGLATLDAWIDPPAYTGIAPMYLREGRGNISVPVGSILNVRVHGAEHAPGLSMRGDHPGFTGENGEYSSSARISLDENVSVRASGATLGSWSIKAIPDLPPRIALNGSPGKTEHAALKLSYSASDDYGVIAVRALIRPHHRPGAPLVFDLPLAQPSARTIKDTVYRDLTENPYAGLSVDIVLEASDAAGQKSWTRTATFTLPARVFTNPLARALIEQRQNLASGNSASRNRVMLTLDALTIAPDKFYQGQAGIYMGLRAAYWALKNAHREDDLEHVESLLWQIAIAVEQGGMAAAAEELRRLQAMITAALAQGAPQEVVDALLERYEQALQRYMQSLAANAPNSNAPPPPGAKVLSEKDLSALLQAIEQLSRSGDRAGAAQLLALLQGLLENLHMTAGGGGGAGPQDKALSDAIQGLGDLMGKQRGLMDRTFRDQQEGKSEGRALSEQQDQIRRQLDKVLGGLNGRKGIPKELGDAGRGMDESQKELSGNDLSDSNESQKEVLNALRKGTGSLADQLNKELAAQGQGEGAGDENGEDPLGRQQGNAGGNFGNGVKLPSQSELQRARSILEELRRRAAERGRPKEELDYIDRLLKEF